VERWIDCSRICCNANIIFFTMSTNAPDGTLSSVSRLQVPHDKLLPTKFDEDGHVLFFKNGSWHTGEECPNCGNIGPACFACHNCNPLGFLYLTESLGVELISNLQQLAVMAHLVHTALAAEPNRDASSAHFLFLLDSYWADYRPGME
jgi:hypothetical protein